MNLYELMGEYARLQTACYGEGEDQPDLETIEKILAELDDTRGELRDKVDNICRLLRNLKANAEALDVEATRLQKRRTALDNSISKLREWVRSSMDVMGVDKIKTAHNTITLAEGKQSVVVLDKNVVPAEYKTTTVTTSINKRDIMAAYKATGEILPGVDIVPGQRVLTIR